MSTIVPSGRTWRNVGIGVGIAGLLAWPIIRELRIRPSAQPLGDAWRDLPIVPRRSTLLGISFRPTQVEAIGLDSRSTLGMLLAYPFQVIRLGAYWNRTEPRPGTFEPSELDWQVDAAEQAGKQIILSVGPLKTFSYPEFFVPPYDLENPLEENTLVSPASHPELLARALEFVARIVDRYKNRSAVIAWQVEHDAVDPLGIEHSWRLAVSWVQAEVEAVRRADPARPIMLNGFLPASLLGQLALWWQTHDQGDSLNVAERLADIVGIDYYPRYALATLGPLSLYVDGSKSPWARRRLTRLPADGGGRRPKLMVTEGQAEPWETVTIAPNPQLKAMTSCLPEHVIANYNSAMEWSQPDDPLYAYLFWGAEYWVLREQSHDPSYLRAFDRILRNT